MEVNGGNSSSSDEGDFSTLDGQKTSFGLSPFIIRRHRLLFEQSENCGMTSLSSRATECKSYQFVLFIGGQMKGRFNIKGRSNFLIG